MQIMSSLPVIHHITLREVQRILCTLGIGTGDEQLEEDGQFAFDPREVLATLYCGVSG